MEEMRKLLMTSQVGICVVLMIFCIVNTSLSKRKKFSILEMSIYSVILAVTDCLANLNISLDVVKPSKFLSYLMPLMIIVAFNHYLEDFLKSEKLKVIYCILVFGIVNLAVSQFTGLYYSFGENGYQRGEGYILSYIYPLTATIMQLIIVIRNRKNIGRKMLYPMIFFIVLPLIVSVAHIFMKGISFVSFTVVMMNVLLYCFSIVDTNKQLEIAHQKEIESLREKEQINHRMVEQITSALVEAVDAKDSYTQGHSRRVADYSYMIAQRAGKNPEECNEIKFIGLLHDVGKIGIPSAIINKSGKLDDEEYQVMKKHPIIGRDILDKITIDTNLRIGACFHHERYDGKGYPFGLKGDEIPEIARIIAVADAYDAMTSKRSYRNSLPQDKVREELIKGLGKQFDPVFGQIMIDILDEDLDYDLRQH